MWLEVCVAILVALLLHHVWTTMVSVPRPAVRFRTCTRDADCACGYTCGRQGVCEQVRPFVPHE